MTSWLVGFIVASFGYILMSLVVDPVYSTSVFLMLVGFTVMLKR